MAQSVRNPFIIDTCRHKIGSLLHLIVGIAHGHTCSGIMQHRDVILSVTEGHDLIAPQPIPLGYPFHPHMLAASDGNDIRKKGGPAGARTTGHPSQQGVFPVGRTESDQLVNILLGESVHSRRFG